MSDKYIKLTKETINQILKNDVDYEEYKEVPAPGRLRLEVLVAAAVEHHQYHQDDDHRHRRPAGSGVL